MPNTAALSPPPRTLDSVQRLALANALDKEIRSLHRRRNEDLARIAGRLAELHRSRGCLSLGFASVQAYAKKRLDWGAGKVKALLELEARLGEQPLIRAAFEAGDVDWSKAVLASRAAQQEPEREANWLQDAQELSSRELEAKVCGRTGEEPRRGRWFELTPEEEAVLDEGLRALRTEGLDLGQGAALAELIRRALQGGSAGSSSYRFLLSRCTDCEQTTHPTGTEDLPVPAAVADRLLCDAEIQDTRCEPARVTRTIPDSVKNQVLARSKGCCEFPGCASRGHLDFHHGRGRRRGHDPDTTFHFCTGHHKAPHEGAVRIQGSWSTGVRFLRADGSLIGTVGGRDGVVPHSAPGDSRDAASVPEPTASRDDASQTPAAGACADPLQEQALALKALEKLALPARRGKQLLHQAFTEQPALRTARAEDLVRAVLLRH